MNFIDIISYDVFIYSTFCCENRKNIFRTFLLKSSPGASIPLTTTHGLLEYCCWLSNIILRLSLVVLVIDSSDSRSFTLVSRLTTLSRSCSMVTCCWHSFSVSSSLLFDVCGHLGVGLFWPCLFLDDIFLLFWPVILLLLCNEIVLMEVARYVLDTEWWY